MLKKILKHVKRFRGPYLALISTLVMVAGFASYEPSANFYDENHSWLQASILESQKVDSVYTRGEFVLDIIQRMGKSACYQDLCSDMKGGMPEEKARCNLEKRDVYGQKANYEWYDQALNRSEAIKTIVTAFGVRMADKIKLPYKDVDLKAWYTPYVKAAYNGKLIKRGNGKLGPDELVTQKWASNILKKTKLDRLCEMTPSI